MSDAEKFDRFLNKARWTFAKTYAKFAPHWYVVRQQFADDPLFNEIVVFIREHAVTEMFYGKPFQCYYHKDGYKYWTMGNPVWQTRIINRTNIHKGRNGIDLPR